MKKKPSPVRVVLILIVLTAFAGILTYLIERRLPTKEHMDLSEYFGAQEESELPVIVNGTRLDGRAAEIGGELYFPYQTAVLSINPRIYYDDAEQLILLASPTEVRKMAVEGLPESCVRRMDGELFFSESYLASLTPMNVQRHSDPERVCVRTEFTRTAAAIVRDGAVRRRAGIKSPILRDLKAGEIVEVLSLENGIDPIEWAKIRTDDGITGYIRPECLGDRYEDEIPYKGDAEALAEYEFHAEEGKINLAFYQADNPSMNETFPEKLAASHGITVISPTWFFLDGPGEVTSIADHDFVETAHANGIRVWALLNDFDGAIGSASETYEALRATSSREAIIGAILNQAEEYGIDGINVDLEHISEDCAPAYLEFLRELAVPCQERGLTLSVDTYVPMAYSSYLNRTELGRVCDYVIIMCYDEHYRGSAQAGSVASIGYVRSGMENAAKEIRAEKLICAIPFYTRLWHTVGNESPGSQLMGMAEAEEWLSEQSLAPRWDEAAGQNYAERSAEDGLWQIWLEDADSVREKMTVVRESGAAGVAEWRLGDETPDIWDVIEEGL